MMTNEGPDLSDELKHQAQRWVLRLRAGEVGPAEIEALGRWRAASPTHRRALAEASLRFDVARAAALNLAQKDGIANLYQAAIALRKRQHTRRGFIATAAAAAACGAYVAINPPLGFWPSSAELLADYRTASGEQRKLTFDGDVAVEMNTRTSLAVGPAQTQARQIELIEGEIAVTAAAMPFTVIAGTGRTSARQAGFDLRREARKVLVTCLGGTVRVESGGNVADLMPQQRVAYDERGLSSIGTVNTVTVEAWRKGLLVFENRPLSEVIEEINRYRRGRIILMNTQLASLPLDATFRLDRIEEAVPKIAHVFGISVRNLPGGVVLLS
jgi:transmembrane sensor